MEVSVSANSTCLSTSFTPQVLEHDWIDEKVISMDRVHSFITRVKVQTPLAKFYSSISKSTTVRCTFSKYCHSAYIYGQKRSKMEL